MPGVGFLLGGVMPPFFDHLARALVAGAGVLAVVAAMAPLLRRSDWTMETADEPLGEIEASRALPAAQPSPAPQNDGQEADRPTQRVTIDASSWAEDS